MQRLRTTPLLAVLAAAPLAAHDVWLEPGAFRVRGAAPVPVRILVGEGFHGDPVPRDPDRIERFVAVGPEGERDVPGVDGAEPAGFLRDLPPGLHVVAYVSRRASLRLDPDRFERHLRAEGLERIAERRALAGDTGAPGREVYSRCAKALVLVGAGGGDAYRRPLGCHFEIVAESSPFDLAPGDQLAVRLLAGGRPLAGALVTALRQGAEARPATALSDGSGRAVFRLTSPGVWLVKSVHMEAAPAGLDADWESWWASLTFAIGSE